MPVDVGAKIGLEGAGAFKRELREITQQSKELASEIKAVTSAFDANDNSQEKLTAQSQVLAKQIDTQNKRISLLNEQYGKSVSELERLETELQQTVQEYGEQSKEADKALRVYRDQSTYVSKLKDDINKATTALNKMAQQQKDLDSAINSNAFDKLTKDIEEQEDEVKRLRTAYQNAVLEFGDASDETQKLGQELSSASSALKQSRDEMQRATDAADELDNSLDDAADSAEAMKGELSSFGEIVEGNVVADGIGRIVDSISSAIEETKEYRRAMASLEVSSQNAGYSASETADTYRELFGVLGDNQTAATTTANLQALGLTQSDLKKVTDSTIGAWATYGDSIPIDSLAEAINETVKTGKVTGTFADVLNWAGTSEDDFNKSLENANDSTERANIILRELSRQGLDKAGKAWKENNKSLVEANEATADQQEALARLAKVAEPVLTELTELATGFINFVVDNKEAVIAAIAGIGAGFAAWKITGIINKAKDAMQAFNASVKANPVGMIVTAASAAVGVISAVVSQLGTTKSKTDEIVEDAKKAKEDLEEAGKNLAESVEGLHTSMDDLKASTELASILGDELVSLAEDTSRTSEEQARMEMLVMELNELFPEMGLAIDDTTGSLNMSTEAIEEYIKNAENMAKMAAAQEKLKEVAADIVDEEVKRTKAGSEAQEIQEQLEEIERKRLEVAEASEKKLKDQKKAQEAYSKAIRTASEDVLDLQTAAQDTSEAMVEYNGQIMSASAALNQMDTDQQKLMQSRRALDETMEDSEEKITSSQETVSEYTEYIQNLTAATDEGTESTQGYTAAQQGNAAAADANTQSLGAELQAFLNMSTAAQNNAVYVVQAMTDMQNAVANAAATQLDLFGAIDENAKITSQTVLDSMQTQVDSFNNWGESLAQLAEKSEVTTAGFQMKIDEGLLQYLAEMGPEGAEYIAAFNEMTGDELMKANQLWNESVDIQGMSTEWGEELATAVGQLAAGSETAWNDLAQQLNVKADEAGNYTGQGFIDAITKVTEQASQATEDLGNNAIDALELALGVASPSWKTEEAGIYTAQGFINALGDEEYAVRVAAQELADEAIPPVSAIVGEYYDSGYYAALGLANGIRYGKSEAVNAAIDLAQSSIQAASSTLEIGSPSKVFEEMGAFSAEGYAIGFDIDGLKKQIAETLTFQQRNFSTITEANIGNSTAGKIARMLPGGNMEFHITVNAADGQSADEIANKVTNKVMYKIQHAVQQKRAVWGT